MQRRSFMLACATLSAGASLFGLSPALKAMAAAQIRNVDRILRVTRNAPKQVTLLTARDVQGIIHSQKSRHTLISLQSKAEYEAGHVPGALLLDPENLTTPAKLAAFVAVLPTNTPIILICSNGHLSCAVLMFLRQLGFDAAAMSFGMYSWNRNYAGNSTYRGDIGGEVTTTISRRPFGKQPVPEDSSELTDRKFILAKSAGKFLFETKPSFLRDNLSSYTVICLRRPEDYAAGHIPGAINISSEAFYNGDKTILQIPRSKKIMLSCYVGHFSCGAALMLRQLGYEAYSLEWGMAGWNNKHIGPILNILQQESDLAVEHGAGKNLMPS